MSKCSICGLPVDTIELDDGKRVPDDCDWCSPRGFTSSLPLERKDYGEPDE